MSKEVVGARELKTRLGTYLRRVRLGESLVVTEHGRPVAELRPLPVEASGTEARLVELAQLGLVTLRERTSLTPFPRVRSEGSSVAADLIAEREDRF